MYSVKQRVILNSFSKLNGYSKLFFNSNITSVETYIAKMSDNRERTFIMLKPDAVQRGIVGEIIHRFEKKGFKLVAMKFMMASEDLLKQHYADLSTRPFFPSLIRYMQMGPVVPMVWEGLNAVKTGRVMLGETNPAESKPGTIRGDLCILTGRYLKRNCHRSTMIKF